VVVGATVVPCARALKLWLGSHRLTDSIPMQRKEQLKQVIWSWIRVSKVDMATFEKGIVTFIVDCTFNPPFNSSILKAEEEFALYEVISKKVKQNPKLELLFRGTRDGFSKDTWRRLAGSKQKTITLIKPQRYDHVFGGYTQQTFTGHRGSGFKEDATAFIFVSRAAPGIIEKYKLTLPTIFDIKKKEDAIFDCYSYGPIFGNGCEFVIRDNANTVTNNWSHFPDETYGDTSGGTKHLRDLLTGTTTPDDCNFGPVENYEVYHVL